MTVTIDTLPIQHHWLPTLSNIVTSDDSFSRDLIKQFDKKRSRLQAEMAGDNISISSDSCLSRRTKTPELTPHPEVPQIITTTVNNKDDTASINIRRRSAGDLLRRSSAYLRAKFEAYKGLKQQDHQDMAPPPEEDDDVADNGGNDDEEQAEQLQQQTRSVFRSWSISKKNKNNKPLTPHIEITDHQNNNNNNNINEKEINNNVHLSSSAIGSLSSSSFSSSTSLPPKKIAVNTTVLIPPPPSHQQYQYTPVQPPIITQYPPRPLKYSPVHPISDNDVEKKISPTTDNRQSSIVDIQSRDIQKDTITKSHHYRRSLPLFKLVHDSTSSPPPPPSSRHRRRSSESDIQPTPSSNQNHHPSFTNWTKTAKRFTYWLGCQPSKIVSKKGKERAKGLNTEKDPS